MADVIDLCVTGDLCLWVISMDLRILDAISHGGYCSDVLIGDMAGVIGWFVVLME